MFFDYSQVSKDGLDQIRKLAREIDPTIDQYEKSYLNDINLNKDSINDNNSLEGAELYEIIKMDVVKYSNNKELAKIEVEEKGKPEYPEHESAILPDAGVYRNLRVKHISK